MAALVAGCTSTSAPADSGTASGSTASGSTGSGAVTTTGSSSGKDSLTVALTSEPNYVSTCDHDSLVGVYMNLLTYNGLVRIDHATLDPVLDLAESYTNDSDTQWTFKLKKGVQFHNGEEFTAQDVIATIDYAKTFPGSANYTGAIDKVEAVDPYTVKITTAKPYPNLLYDLAYHYNFMLPKSLIDSGNDFNTNPIGTGPYVFKEWNRGDSLVFEAFPDYFDKEHAAKIKNLKFVIIPEGATRTIALESGDVDFVYEVASSDISRLLDTKSVEVAQVVSVENFFLNFNNVSGPFDDLNLRNAISYAIDRKEVVASALNGYGTASYSCIPQGYWGSSTENAVSLDLDKAKKYLEAWGGDPSTVELSIICNNDTKVAIATVIQNNLSKIGIKVKVDTMDTAAYFEATAGLDFDSAITSWSPSNALTYVQRYHSRRRSGTPSAMADSGIDALVEKAETTMDKNERLSLINEIVSKVNLIQPQAPLYQVNYFRAYNAGLGGVVASATGYVGFNDIYWK